jgi:hypothetical protein
MRKVTSLIFVLIIIISIFYPINTTLAKKAKTAYCCNIFDPRYYTSDPWSWKCIQNGIEVEILISQEMCMCAWHINNWQPPIGMNCNALQECTLAK